MRLVLVTDRRLMGGEAGFGAAIAAAVARLPAGAAIVQVREKDLAGRALLALVRAAIAAAPAQRVVVNDRLDVALAAGAGGVHLPEDGLDLAAARALAPPGFLIGCSRHGPAACGAAVEAGADLVQLGPVWATPGKGAPVGVAALAAAARAMRGRGALVAVGGIDAPARANAARDAGASAVAVIRAVWTAADPAAAALALS